LWNCSSRTQKYLLFHNPVTWPTAETNDREELAALRTALALGHLLDRAVILPRFHCTPNGGGLGGPPPGSPSSASSSARWTASASSRYRRRPVHRMPGSAAAAPPSTTGPPAEPDRECPLNGLLNVSAFDAQFADRYRENSFLRHPLVPEDVRLDRSPPLSVHALMRAERGKTIVGDDDEKLRSRVSASTAAVLNSPPGESLPVNVSSLSSSSSSSLSSTASSSASASAVNSAVTDDEGDPLPKAAVTLSASDAVRLLGGIGNRVLELRSLYRIDLVFDDTASQTNFDSRVRKAFHRGTYRQL
jgi:hypothetical protein